MSQINQAQHGIASGPGGGGSNPANARLFGTVVVYNTPGTLTITPAPGEDAQIDLAAIGNDVTVQFDPAAAADVGKAIGVTLLSESSSFSVFWNGNVDFLVPAPIQQASDCELFTWDPAADVWHMVVAFRRSAIVLSSWTIPQPFDATPLAPLAGEFARIDMSLSTADVPVTFPALGLGGQFIALQISIASPDGFAVDSGFDRLVNVGDTAIYVCVSPGIWVQLLAEVPEWLTPIGGTEPANGQVAIDSGAQTILLPEAPTDGTYVGVKTTNGGTTVSAQGADSIDNGDGTSTTTSQLPYAGAGALYVYSGGIWWAVGAYIRTPQLHPTQETNATRTVGLLDIGELIECTVACEITVPAQATVAWPTWAVLDFLGEVTVVGDPGVSIGVRPGKDPIGEGTLARTKLERLSNTDEWVLSGELADTGP